MAYDETLASRIRQALGAEADITEKRMFGGLAFLIGGHMAVAASGQGGLMVRCEPEQTDDLLGEPGAHPMEMQGREIDGWLRVDDEAVQGEPDLAAWVGRGAAYARSLPPKG